MNRNFDTREAYQQALLSLLEPVSRYYSPGCALVQMGVTGVPYGQRVAGLEGFARLLWGLVPLWMGGADSPLDDRVIQGIRSGSDPANPEYWGRCQEKSQSFVEMAALSFALLGAPQKVWDPLTRQEQERFAAWMWQINEHNVADNNWRFFRVLVNCGLRRVGARYSAEQVERDLARLDEFYLGDGWYSDGPTAQRDYYIAFAMHFYSLLYAVFCETEDPERSRRYKERAAVFAKDYIYWFGTRGEALPYGRSLTYRFAQGAFWGALAFAGVEPFPWGVVRGIVSRQLRWWFDQPILDAEGKLTLGYTYPNLTMCEGYNSPNSPYWSFKAFLVLALPETHPFWTAAEAPLPALEPCRALPHAGMIVQRGMDGYVTVLTSGQYATWEPAFAAEKYGKFAYSSYFGFQTARGYNQLHLTAPDNMLAFLRDGLYHVRRTCEKVEVGAEEIRSVWTPMEGVRVTTILRPDGDGHIRCHIIEAERPCTAVEGGFALPVHDPEEICAENDSQGILLRSNAGRSGICLLKGEGTPAWTACEPNVNVVHPLTVLPYLTYHLPAGRTELCVRVEAAPFEKGEQ